MQKRRQFALITLAILDVAVLATLGYLTITRNPSATPSSPQVSACSQIMLESLPSYLSPAVAWETESLDVMLTAFYDTPVPPESSAQLIWEVLDSIKRAVKIGCAVPAQVSILATGHGQQQSENHYARITGTDLTLWAENVLSEENLCLRSAYWKNSESQPSNALYPAP